MTDTLWLACGVLKCEMEALLADGSIGGRALYTDSMLHMDPVRLEAVLRGLLDKEQFKAGRLVLVFGDCAPGMLDLAGEYTVRRVRAINCAQMLLGRETYRERMKEGAFLLLPEWARRWKEVIQEELGMNRTVAADLFGEHRSALVYLDTGLVPVPRDEITACALYTGLSWRIEPVTLESLKRLLREAEEG